jgi:thiosulfate dehydrogenase
LTPADHHNKALVKAVGLLVNLVVCLTLIIAGLLVALYKYAPAYHPQKEGRMVTPDSNGLFTEEARKYLAGRVRDTTHYWTAPALESVQDTIRKKQLQLGKDLIANTTAYLGERGSMLRSAINGMNCQNCHLDAGTRIYGNNYSAVAATYPKYRPRSGTIESVHKRINDCIERSLNGKALDTGSVAMRAMTAYILWLGKNSPKGKKPPGAGFRDMTLLDRPADPVRGESVYTLKCALCHQKDGEGTRDSLGIGYKYPPLWGKKSYNTGAGMYRLHNFARFVKYNMPHGTTYLNPQLTDEDSWDVAAYVNSQPRPALDLTRDWPKLAEKPFDYPFGPYADGFDEKRHKYGPFPLAANNKTR